MNKGFLCFLGIVLVLFILTPACANGDDLARERKEMLRLIEADAPLARKALGRDHFDARVLRALGKVPRHEFVPPSLRGLAYLNQPLPIGYGQTISQPYIVALMTDLMGLKKTDRVLEVGTGSGYQAAVLGEIAESVYTIEIINELAESASTRLKRFGYRNVEVIQGDGYFGLKEHAPFDAIIVTAAAGHVPSPLIDQVKPGGRIIIPVGGVYQVQILMVVTRDKDGRIRTAQVMPVSFVPLTGRALKEE